MNPRLEAESLVKRIMEGDAAAETELVERYQRGIAILLRRKVRDATVAEDLFQEVFYLAIEKIRNGEVRQPNRLNAYLAGLTANLVIGHFRKESKHNPPGAVSNFAAHGALSIRPTQFDSLLFEERARVTRQTLAELKSERDRDLLFRFYIAGEEKDQICHELGLTAIHFNRVLYRAKQRYKRLLLKEQTFKD